MLRIGLTGGIGSGKTTVSDYFKSLYNIPIIDADEISHELMLSSGDAFKDVINLFGSDSVLESGEIDRKHIRQRIFQDSSLRISLEQIIHPKVEQAIINKSQNLDNSYCLIVIPLLIESNMQSTTDRILLVSTKEELQLSRVAQRDQCTANEVQKIINNQLSLQEKIEQADDVIVNNGTREELIPQIEAFHQKYLALSK